MKFQVAGHYQGKRIKTATLEASSREEAESKARARGVDVESVWPLDELAESGWGEVIIASSPSASAPPPLPDPPAPGRASRPELRPASAMDAAAAIHSVLLSIEHQIKRSNEKLAILLILVFLIALPMLLAALWFMMMFALGVGAAARMAD